MTNQDIIAMAREIADPEKVDPWDEQCGWCVLTQAELERLDAAIRADAIAEEREAFTKLLQDASKTGKIISCLSAAAAIREALASEAIEQPAQPKYRRGDKLICLETEEYCIIHISGTDRQWVKFPDTHIGVYKNEQLAELFELLPKEIDTEQPAQTDWEAVAADQAMTIALLKAEQPAQQEPVAWKWQPAPIRTAWGDEMVVASVAIDKDHTVCLYCEREQIAKVEVMFAQRQARSADTWVGLTDEEIWQVWGPVAKRMFGAHHLIHTMDVNGIRNESMVLNLARAIEATLKEKNSD